MKEESLQPQGSLLNFRFTDFEINIARQEIRRAGAIVHVEPQVFDLLVYLIRNRDRIVGKDELIDAIWRGRVVSEATLSSRISAARRALGDSGNDQSLIRTLYKRGFRFVGDVDDDSAPAAIAIEKTPQPPGAAHDASRPVPAGEPLPLSDKPSIAASPLQNVGLAADQEYSAEGLTAAAASRSTPPNRASAAAGEHAISYADSGADAALLEKGTASTVRRAARSPLSTIAATGLTSLLITAAWWLLSSRSPAPTPYMKDPIAVTRESESLADRRTALAPTIMVLPFINLSGDAKQAYVAEGITDNLISVLARALPGVSVVSRDTALTYKGRSADARQIGRELDVRYLLNGSVVVEAERVRVNIQLVETTEGNQLWAERFDTELKSILEVQDEIVGRVSRAISLKIVDFEARRSQRERPSSTELMDLILRGKSALNQPTSPATMIEARDLFEQALKVQPSDVDALAGVATTLIFEFLNGYYEAEGDQRLHRAELLLDQAIAIEPRHVMALKAKAALRRAQGKFDDAIAAAEAVIMENPGEPWAYKEIGLSTMYLGQPEQALDWFAKADRIGPRDPERWTWLDGRGHDLILLGRDEEAIHSLIGALDVNPKNFSSHAFLAAAYALLGRSDEARAALAAYLQRRPDVRVSTFRRLSPVPLALTSPKYRQQFERISEGLRRAGLPE